MSKESRAEEEEEEEANEEKKKPVESTPRNCIDWFHYSLNESQWLVVMSTKVISEKEKSNNNQRN